MTIRVLIADDEPVALAGVARLVSQDTDLTVVAECANGRDALEAMQTFEPDIALLDIEMPGLHGLDVVRALDGESLPVVVFITAFDHYAIRAFDARAVGYLVKPFNDDRFRSVLEHAKAMHRALSAHERTAQLRDLLLTVDASNANDAGDVVPDTPLTRLLIRSGDRIALVPVEDVDWIEAADYYVRIHTGGKGQLIRETMSGLERRLNPQRFFRIHRSVIVNLDRVRELVPTFRGDHVVVLKDGTRLTLSNARRKRFEQRLGQRL